MEFALAFLLWFRPTRKWIALLGVLLHLGIVPLVNVPLFGEQMTALYLLFLAPDELTRCSGSSTRAAGSNREATSCRHLRHGLTHPVRRLAGASLSLLSTGRMRPTRYGQSPELPMTDPESRPHA